MRKNANNQNLSEECMKLSFNESQYKYKRIDSLYNSLRGRMLAFLPIELPVLAFFLADVKDYFPSILSYQIILCTAVLLLIISVAILSYCCMSVDNWTVPFDGGEREEIKHAKSIKHAYKILEKSYQESYQDAYEIYKKRAKYFNKSIICFAVGVFILLVIKFF